MIISASRRTDIPSYFSDWFYERIKDGYVLVRNPMNPYQIRKVPLHADIVDGIVFWTKNPYPMMERLDELREYIYYFQFTLNAYGKDLEANVPSKKELIIPTFQKLSKKIGRNRVVWRYDPIIINTKYTVDYHIKYFEILANKLSDYTEKCTVSFLDYYKNTKRNISGLGIVDPTSDQKEELMERFSEIAKRTGIYIDTCAENIELNKKDIPEARCIDIERLENLGKYRLNAQKDANQRILCACVSSIDIGEYNTCKNNCLYCYANLNPEKAAENFSQHYSHSDLIRGFVKSTDTIKERDFKSLKKRQLNLFD